MDHSTQEGRLAVSGVSGVDGSYLWPALTPFQIAALARGWQPRPEHLNELRRWHEATSREHWGLQEGDPRDLADTGWAVIFAEGADPDVRRALRPLLDHRREQATRRSEDFYRELTLRPGESKHDFLPRHGAAPGRPANPAKGVPYYLLIVGGPGEIPFRFQYQLDVQYAVGRVAFDEPGDYERYARGVIRAERDGTDRPRKVTFFGVRHDRSTELSHDHLVGPLADGMRAADGWEIETVLAGAATKDRLARLLGGDATPSLLFTASHGVGFPRGHPRQRTCQGALLCQEWPGPRAGKATPDHYLSAADVRDDACPLGLLAFHFACYGGGTPRHDDFAHRASGERAELAPEAFVARLAQRLLGHPRGGALAIVAHVDRTWGYSFLWPGAGGQLQVFEATLRRLIDGHPVGSAMELFNQSYAELSTGLAAELEEIEYGKTPDDPLLARLWTAQNDARNFVVLGDPAVRVPATAHPRE